MRKERIDRAVNGNVPEHYSMSYDDDASMSQKDASMSQKDASITDESFPHRPRTDASRSHTSGKTEPSSSASPSSSSPNPPDNAATADYTDEVQRQMELTQANLLLLRKQEQEKRRIAAEQVKQLEETEANRRQHNNLNLQQAIASSLREQRMGQDTPMANPKAKARVKKEERRGGKV